MLDSVAMPASVSAYRAFVHYTSPLGPNPLNRFLIRCHYRIADGRRSVTRHTRVFDRPSSWNHTADTNNVFGQRVKENDE